MSYKPKWTNEVGFLTRNLLKNWTEAQAEYKLIRGQVPVMYNNKQMYNKDIFNSKIKVQ